MPPVVLRYALSLLLILSFCLAAVSPTRADEELAFPLQAEKILFLGDSITAAGGYIVDVEFQLRTQGLEQVPTILNLGLGSETCSGLSEEDHPFPRPDVHERLERALDQYKPDVVVACYGMNDGIYHPFSQERFTAYQDGVRKLVEKVHARDAKIIVITPPPFDPVPIRDKGKLVGKDAEKFAYFAPFENYDNVLKTYGQWIMKNDFGADAVVNVHVPISRHLAEQRKKDPNFTVAPDSIHLNGEGHRLFAERLLKSWGFESFVDSENGNNELWKLIRSRQRLEHSAWHTQVGHLRPGGKNGPPMAEAESRATELNKQIETQTAKLRQPQTRTHSLAGGKLFEVDFLPSIEPGKLKLGVTYSLWIANSDLPARSIIVHQHGCGEGASIGGQTAVFDLHWQSLARDTQSALFGSSYEAPQGASCRLWCDPRNGSDERFQQGLAELARLSGKPEVAEVPWCLWGHSGGGFWASLMQTIHPERIVAIWLQSGTAYGYWSQGDIPAPEIPKAAYGVPVMGNPGLKEKDHERFKNAWIGIVAMQEAYLEAGAPFFEFAPDPRTGHETGDSRYLSIPFFRFWLEQRLPEAGSQAKLKPVSQEMVQRWDDNLAGQLAEFIREGAVSDDSAPPAPRSVSVKKLDNGIELTWDAHADPESGIQQFVILRDGQEIARVPEQPKGRFGRPLFQAMSYHDTPERPLPEMRYVDNSEGAKPEANYAVKTINSVGMASAATSAK